MKKIVGFILGVLLLSNSLPAQKTVAEVNYLLDTQPYFGFRINYTSKFILPDSIKQKLLIALSGRLTPHLQDSLLTFTAWQKEMFLEQSKQQCKADSVCVEQAYQKIIADVRRSNNHFYMNEPISGELILAAGNWNVKEAIPLLKNAMGSKRYGQRAILMALAKLGDDSVKQVLAQKYTLSYTIKNTQDDTINDNVILYDLPTKTWSATEGIDVAMYLQSKKMLLNILELIYIRGISGFCIGEDCYDYPYVSFLVNEFSDYNYFNKFPNYEKLYKICNDYSTAIRDLYRKKRNRKERKELDTLLSTAYRTKVKEQLREWVIENVNFE